MSTPTCVNPQVLRIVESIRENPGIYKRRLMELHPDIKNMREVLSSARKTYGLIENRGSNTQSCWFVIGAPLVFTPEERIYRALQVAHAYGGVDSAHRKRWVIDQMVRALTGGEGSSDREELSKTEEYEEFVTVFNTEGWANLDPDEVSDRTNWDPGYLKGDTCRPRTDVLELVEVIRQNPGIDRRGLDAFRPDTNSRFYALESARSSRLIENRGNRRNSAWYVIE